MENSWRNPTIASNNEPKYIQFTQMYTFLTDTTTTNNNNNKNMETCKAQESVKQPLTALQTGVQKNKNSKKQQDKK